VPARRGHRRGQLGGALDLDQEIGGAADAEGGVGGERRVAAQARRCELAREGRQP
jgi:hypothetical protein